MSNSSQPSMKKRILSYGLNIFQWTHNYDIKIYLPKSGTPVCKKVA